MGESAYGSNQQQPSGSFRRTWDTEEYAAKAREKAKEAREYAQEAEKARQEGKRPPPRRKDRDLPKPTEKMQAHEDLELDKNQGKVMVVSNPTGRGPGAPGYYCDVCSRTYKDSAAYLDHLNSRSHLKRLGQTTKVKRSTLDQVRLRIAELREKSQAAANAKAYDFEARIKEIKQAEQGARREKREAKKKSRQAKAAAAAATPGSALGAAGGSNPNSTEPTEEEAQMAAMMGFSGFK